MNQQVESIIKATDEKMAVINEIKKLRNFIERGNKMIADLSAIIKGDKPNIYLQTQVSFFGAEGVYYLPLVAGFNQVVATFYISEIAGMIKERESELQQAENKLLKQ